MITQDQKNQIIKLYNEGFSSTELGKLFLLAHTTILYHVKNPGKLIVSRRKKGGKKPVEEQSAWERKKMFKEQKEIRKKVAKSYADYLRLAEKRRLVRNEIGESIEEVDV